MVGFILYDKAGFDRNRWFASAIEEYGAKRGVELKTVIREELDICMKDSRLSLYRNNLPVDLPHFVINRCIDPFLAECLELAGVSVFNSAKACRICNDKRLTHMFFQGRGIKMTDSIFCQRDYDGIAKTDFPSVVKSAVGHGGSEVFMVNNEDELKAAMDKIDSEKYLLQKPVSTLGRDLRVYVMDGKVLCSVLRSCDSDFRSNFSLGGKASLFKLTKSQENLALEIAEALDITFGGIDFIFNGDEMLLNEVEDVVGSRMIYSLTDLPVHQLLVDTVLGKL